MLLVGPDGQFQGAGQGHNRVGQSELRGGGQGGHGRGHEESQGSPQPSAEILPVGGGFHPCSMGLPRTYVLVSRWSTDLAVGAGSSADGFGANRAMAHSDFLPPQRWVPVPGPPPYTGWREGLPGWVSGKEDMAGNWTAYVKKTRQNF